ncbi:flagellar protein FliS [Sphingomonas ginkgonis]|uniref:Flagellar protein FliS n=1 Tax=Sphingomonas ginkgonis TaxID=2315330 RepID=A0A429VCF2_9SPHN|nr:flagellar protein FliS [Sphingomonas ginkgonis]RST31556.1 flagellar protein FliS [Sphingomonas ginkgonis]
MYAARKTYQTLSVASRIEAAGPHELVAILYEELLRALDVTRAALLQGKPEALRQGRERASSILIALEASLDFERGGTLAPSLGRIYRSMQKELAAFGNEPRAERLEAVRKGVGDLLGAWVQIAVRQAA